MTFEESYNLPRAALATTLAALMFASMGVAVRYASASLPSEVLVFLRNSFGLLFLLPWLYHRGFRGLKTNRLSGHITRSVTGLAAMYCFFYAIAHLPLAEAVLLNFSSPIFTAIMLAGTCRRMVNRRNRLFRTLDTGSIRTTGTTSRRRKCCRASAVSRYTAVSCPSKSWDCLI